MQSKARTGTLYIAQWGVLLLLWSGFALLSPAESQVQPQSKTRTQLQTQTHAQVRAQIQAQPQAQIQTSSIQPAQSHGDWAQPSGFRFGVFMDGTGIGTEDSPSNANPNDLYIEGEGGGLTLMVGYSVSRRVDLYLRISGSTHETSQQKVEAFFSTGIIEAHVQMLPDERVRPYFIGGLGGVGMTVDADEFKSEIAGGAMVLGVGMLWNITDHLLLDSALRLDFIDWDEVKLTRTLPSGQELALVSPVDEEGGAGHFQLGLTWAF